MTKFCAYCGANRPHASTETCSAVCRDLLAERRADNHIVFGSSYTRKLGQPDPVLEAIARRHRLDLANRQNQDFGEFDPVAAAVTYRHQAKLNSFEEFDAMIDDLDGVPPSQRLLRMVPREASAPLERKGWWRRLTDFVIAGLSD